MIGAIVFASQGSYSDHTSWPVAMFVDVELANAHRAEIVAEVERLRAVLGEDVYRVSATPMGLVKDTYEADDKAVPSSLPSLGLWARHSFDLDLRESEFSVVEMELRGWGGP